MAEEAEGAEASGNGVDAAALALGLGGASREKADAFLDDQRKLVQLQAKELAHELGLRHWSLWVRHASGLLKLAFEFSVALVLLAVVAFLTQTIWSAAHDNGLVIEAFSVPPDLAARGLTGQVVATQLLDNLSVLTAQQSTVRAANSYANNWGNDIKVEIPETGVSIGQLNTYLHTFLGHQTHITGEVVRTNTGITVTARAGNTPGQRFSGPEADFDRLMQQATEAVFAGTQTYRYGAYLTTQGKYAQALAFFSEAARTQPPAEQVWDSAGMSNVFVAQHRPAEALQAAKTSVTIDPDFAWGWGKVAADEGGLGRSEAALAADRTTIRLLDQKATGGMRPEAVPSQRESAVMDVDSLLGDFAERLRLTLARNPSLANTADPARQIQDALSNPGSALALVVTAPASRGSDLIAVHDLTGARRILAEAPAFQAAIMVTTLSRNDIRGQAISDSAAHNFRVLELRLAGESEDWARIPPLADALDAEEAKLNAAYAAYGPYPPVFLWPWRALAEARQGHFKTAHAWIDRTPSDCDLCLRMRARIDEAEKNNGGADYWFARAVAAAPSIPFATAEWGQSLLERGDADGAIAQFTLSNKKGPHFADPLEYWGEALMAKNQSHLALAKFAEADKYAPNWGRLHLKWGEALTYAGKAADAKAQFARAAALDLTPSEKSELARSHAVAPNP